MLIFPAFAALALLNGAAALPSTTGSAAFQSNLAYLSPSTTVSQLQIDTEGVVARLGKRWADTYQGNLSFPYGVASGDPYSDSVILWTMPRKVDLEGLYGGNAWPAVCVLCPRSHLPTPPLLLSLSPHTCRVVSNSETDFSIASSVQHGYAQSTIDVRFAIKVEATGLAPYTKYYYRFESCEGADLGASPVGIFKTLPAEDDEVTSLRLAFYSCSNLPFGFFNAYGAAANHSDTLDYVQHVGDYIYEYKNGDYGDGTAIGRVPQPDRELSSLQDYRDRYAQYRTDPDLQELHRVLAWQTVWDDHEVADNAWAHGSADSNDTLYGQVGDYQFSARKANAVRAYFEWMPIRQVDTDDKLVLPSSQNLYKENVSLLLPVAAHLEELQARKTRGYVRYHLRVPMDMVIIHATKSSRPVLIFRLAGPKFTDATYVGLATKLVEASPVLQYAEGQLRGYVELTITPHNVTADYFGFYDQLTRNSNVTHMGSFTTTKGTNKLDRPLNGGKKVAFGALGPSAA
ncbi:alkaline phosphatase D, partial [Phenoliferia sp. Uapishka_3]